MARAYNPYRMGKNSLMDKVTTRGIDMKNTFAVVALAAVLMLALAAPAFAGTGAGGAGREFGQHHATHAQEMGGFTGTDNPGVMHKGFSGWPGL